MSHLVIVAGGLGSRLQPLTNKIPKFLVNIGKNTGYVEMVRYWEKHLDSSIEESSLTVIIHSSYVSLVSEYHKLYFPNICLIIKTVDVADGSAHAILSTCEHLIGKAVMFTWCDVIPEDDIEVSELGIMHGFRNVVFTNYNGSCRYGLKRASGNWVDKVVYKDEAERGGIFGLYYINNFRTQGISSESGQDFVDIIHQYGKLTEHRLENIIDFGDAPKLEHVRGKADEAREFNSVQVLGDYVLKQATNEQGLKIIAKEITWYQTLEELVKLKGAERPSVPRTWVGTDSSGFFMTKVKGMPIWKAWPKLSNVDRYHVITQVIAQREALFALGTGVIASNDLMFRPRVIVDVQTEAGTKIHARYEEIKGVVDSFGKVSSVNGQVLKYSDPKETITRLTDAIMSHYKENPPEYGFIHGDLQRSNSMVDLNTMKVSIIDPRGYFGKTECFGLADYDIGKLLYSLSGYDEFNYSKTFHIESIDSGDIRFTIPTPSHDGIESIMLNYFEPIHYAWLAVCFIGLAQYIKNDPVKAVCAHYHGLALAEKFLAL